jgi:hypothetical protein
MRRIKVTEFQADDIGVTVLVGGKPVALSETWPDDSTTAKILSLMGGKPQPERAVEWSEETVAHARELEQQLRKVEHDNEALAIERDKANEERHWLQLFVVWFVEATGFDVWRGVLAKALEHELRESGVEDEGDE